MIKISSLKLNIEHSENDIRKAAAAKLRIKATDIKEMIILKKSIDARKKDNVHYVYSVAVTIPNESRVIRNSRSSDIGLYEDKVSYKPVIPSREFVKSRPVIAGFGPAGFTCAYLLSLAGLRPIVLERGEDIDNRDKKVSAFWAGTAPLDPESNVQFGEGGAGSYSDGKLNTMIHDNYGRIGFFYDMLIENGADPSIRYTNKPHIGTDKLKGIVKNIRKSITDNGGEIRFRSRLTDIVTTNGSITAVKVNDSEEIPCSQLILAIGHSSRDTYEMLVSKGIAMEEKPFAMGVRVQHPQELISRAQYGDAFKRLPAADYKLTYNSPVTGRSVYSFCMCPGGLVVNASSEEGRLAVNGMSYSGRSEYSANSAIVVNITEKDYPDRDVLSGMRFQQELEEKAYRAGNGLIPSQYLQDFYENKATASFSADRPNTCGGYTGSNLNGILPEFMSEAIKEAFESFDKNIKGFKYNNAILMGVESRTSAPLRILRNERLQSINVSGLFPCGEGAGYAGGITSAGVDGIKVYEAVIEAVKSSTV